MLEKIKKLFKFDESGFSLVEVMVATLIFSIIISVVSAAYVQVLKLQHRGSGIQAVQENAQFALELMAREIRASIINTLQDADCTTTFRSTLTIEHPVNKTVTYALVNNIIRRTAGGTTHNITSDNVKITKLNFCIFGSSVSDKKQARVAIVATAQAVGQSQEQLTINIETMVAIRDIDLELSN